MITLLKKLNIRHCGKICITIAVALFLLAFSSQAQNAKKMFENYKTQYPDVPYIVLDKTEITSIDIVDDQIEITEKYLEENFYLEGDVGYLADDKIQFSDFLEVDEVKALSYAPKGNRFVSNKVKSFKEETEFSSGIFHNDLKSLNFTYPALQKGSKTSLSYTTKVKEPRFLNGFYFITRVPTLQQKFVLEVHPDVEVDIKQFNTDAVDISFNQSKKGGKNIYTWVLNNSPRIKLERNTPKIRHFVPHLMPHITHYTIKGEKKSLLAGPDDLFAWYNSLIKNVNSEIEEDALIDLVKDITKNATTDIEKAKAIFYWTQDQIKYIAFEEGMDGFIPRNTDKVISQRYGDCKDMSTCITTLLKYADVPASLCWIGTNEIPYSYNELPTPSVDNHMIAALKHEEEYYFLDATSNYLPFGMPSRFIQGKEAMVRTGEDSYELVKVPFVDGKQNSQIEVSKLKIEDDKLTGSSTKTFNGYYKTEFNHELAGKDEAEKYEFWSKELKKGSNKFILDALEVKDEFNKEKPTELSYTFNIDDYMFTNNDEIYVNLSLYDWYDTGKLEADRQLPFRVKFKAYHNITHQLEIPEGYAVSFVPKDVILEEDLYTYRSTYTQKDNQIIHLEELIENYIQLEKEDFENYNNFIDAVDETKSQSIILQKK